MSKHVNIKIKPELTSLDSFAIKLNIREAKLLSSNTMTLTASNNVTYVPGHLGETTYLYIKYISLYI